MSTSQTAIADSESLVNSLCKRASKFHTSIKSYLAVPFEEYIVDTQLLLRAETDGVNRVCKKH